MAETDKLDSNIEAFRGNLFIRLLDQSVRPARQFHVPLFKQLVADLGGLLSGVYDSTQVFEMECLLSLQLTLALPLYCPEVPESSAQEAGEWMVPVVGKLLDQADKRDLGNASGAGALALRDAISVWLADSGLFQELCNMQDAKRSTTCVTFSPSCLSEKRFQPTSLCKVCERRP